MRVAVNAAGISKTFGNFTLNSITFECHRGEVFGILGPNGAGKTTTLRIIAGLVRPDSGKISVFGRDPERMRDYIGYLPEERGLYRKWKVSDVLYYFAELKGGANTEYWIDRFGMEKHENKKIEELSKGLQQKVQLIIAVQHNPDLLILDEPFSGLDAVNINLVMEIVKEMREKRRCIILSTHILNLAERLCDRVLLINNGREVLSGRVDELSDEEVQEIEYRKNGRIIKEITDRDLKDLLNSGYDIISYRKRKLTLEEIFLREVSR